MKIRNPDSTFPAVSSRPMKMVTLMTNGNAISTGQNGQVKPSLELTERSGAASGIGRNPLAYLHLVDSV
jgi:hypothetical protein